MVIEFSAVIGCDCFQRGSLSEREQQIKLSVAKLKPIGLFGTHELKFFRYVSGFGDRWLFDVASVLHFMPAIDMKFRMQTDIDIYCLMGDSTDFKTADICSGEISSCDNI